MRSLRDAIVRGDWDPGNRLPTRVALAQRFRAGPPAIQAAMDQLCAEGWIRAEDTKGTFVNARLPHWTRYALILPSSPADPGNAGPLHLRA